MGFFLTCLGISEVDFRRGGGYKERAGRPPGFGSGCPLSDKTLSVLNLGESSGFTSPVCVPMFSWLGSLWDGRRRVLTCSFFSFPGEGTFCLLRKEFSLVVWAKKSPSLGNHRDDKPAPSTGGLGDPLATGGGVVEDDGLASILIGCFRGFLSVKHNDAQFHCNATVMTLKLKMEKINTFLTWRSGYLLDVFSCVVFTWKKPRRSFLLWNRFVHNHHSWRHIRFSCGFFGRLSWRR